MMVQSTLTQIKNEVIAKLDTALTNIRILDGFCREQFFGEVNVTSLAVKISSVKTAAAAFDNFLGGGMSGQEWQDFNGEQAETAFSFNLFLPLCENVIAHSNVFEQICYALRETASAEFFEFYCSALEFSESAQCFVCTFSAKANCLLVETAQAVLLSDFELNTEIK